MGYNRFRAAPGVQQHLPRYPVYVLVLLDDEYSKVNVIRCSAARPSGPLSCPPLECIGAPHKASSSLSNSHWLAVLFHYDNKLRVSPVDSDQNFKTLVGVVLQAEAVGRPRHELLLDLGETPASIIAAGGGIYSGRDLVLKGKTVGKMHFDHGIPRGVIERLPQILNAPKAIYRSANQAVQGGGSVVVMTFETYRGYPLIVPVHAKKQIGRGLYNEVASMYAKEGPNPEAKWKAAGLLLWER